MGIPKIIFSPESHHPPHPCISGEIRHHSSAQLVVLFIVVSSFSRFVAEKLRRRENLNHGRFVAAWESTFTYFPLLSFVVFSRAQLKLKRSQSLTHQHSGCTQHVRPGSLGLIEETNKKRRPSLLRSALAPPAQAYTRPCYPERQPSQSSLAWARAIAVPGVHATPGQGVAPYKSRGQIPCDLP